MNKLIIQLRNGSSGSPALMIMPLSFIKVGKEKAAKQQGLLFLHARAYLPQSGQLWSADVHGGVVLSNIVTFNDVLEGMLCVGGAAHRIVL